MMSDAALADEIRLRLRASRAAAAVCADALRLLAGADDPDVQDHDAERHAARVVAIPQLTDPVRKSSTTAQDAGVAGSIPEQGSPATTVPDGTPRPSKASHASRRPERGEGVPPPIDPAPAPDVLVVPIPILGTVNERDQPSVRVKRRRTARPRATKPGRKALHRATEPDRSDAVVVRSAWDEKPISLRRVRAMEDVS